MPVEREPRGQVAEIVAEGHGGSILADTPESGVRFAVRLPRAGSQWSRLPRFPLPIGSHHQEFLYSSDFSSAFEIANSAARISIRTATPRYPIREAGKLIVSITIGGMTNAARNPRVSMISCNVRN